MTSIWLFPLNYQKKGRGTGRLMQDIMGAFNAVDQFNSARHGKTVLVNLNMLKGDNRPGFFKHLLASKLIESGNEPNLADIL
eukprot:g25450.t1